VSTPEDPFASPEPGDTPPPSPPQPPTSPPAPSSPTAPTSPTAPPYGGSPQGQPPYAAPSYGQPTYGQPPYGQPTYGQAQPPYGGYPAARKTNGLAIAALVCSLAAFVTCISAPVGLVLGLVALSQIKKTGEDGRGLALAGAWIGGVVTALAVIGAIVLVAVSVWFVDEVDKIDGECDRNTSTQQQYDRCMEDRFNDRFGIDG
jgi:hypothetical protein